MEAGQRLLLVRRRGCHPLLLCHHLEAADQSPPTAPPQLNTGQKKAAMKLGWKMPSWEAAEPAGACRKPWDRLDQQSRQVAHHRTFLPQLS